MYSNSVSHIISPEVIFDSRMSNIDLDTVVQACSANYMTYAQVTDILASSFARGVITVLRFWSCDTKFYFVQVIFYVSVWNLLY
jgi:hypothetical protein